MSSNKLIPFGSMAKKNPRRLASDFAYSLCRDHKPSQLLFFAFEKYS